MKRGAHLLAPGPEDVKGGFVRGFMSFAGWDQCGGQSTREIDRVHHCNVCEKSFKSLQTPKRLKQSNNVFVCKGFGKKLLTNNPINRQKKLVCGKPCLRKRF